MTNRQVRYEVADGVATLTLDSPHNRNAISSTLVGQLRQGLTDAQV
ncbi:enoyl-CoA hydratase, partial [Rhodococcus hoagii]|nr:enoyl-CoA hydratase [Prescottella equi]